MLWGRNRFKTPRHRHSLLPTLAALRVGTLSKELWMKEAIDQCDQELLGLWKSTRIPARSIHQPMWCSLLHFLLTKFSGDERKKWIHRNWKSRWTCSSTRREELGQVPSDGHGSGRGVGGSSRSACFPD